MVAQGLDGEQSLISRTRARLERRASLASRVLQISHDACIWPALSVSPEIRDYSSVNQRAWEFIN